MLNLEAILTLSTFFSVFFFCGFYPLNLEAYNLTPPSPKEIMVSMGRWTVYFCFIFSLFFAGGIVAWGISLYLGGGFFLIVPVVLSGFVVLHTTFYFYEL